jgi:hypothetical protein
MVTVLFLIEIICFLVFDLRLWTVHPKYLDTKGLVALWRESLLAQKVLMGGTRGWRNHPQLDRFKGHSTPVSIIGAYLCYVEEEGSRRGYHFMKERICRKNKRLKPIVVSRDFVLLELNQLKNKLKHRDSRKYGELLSVSEVDLNPVFRCLRKTRVKI